MARRSYKIQRGDTLSEIAARNGISLARLLEWNPTFRSNPKYQSGNMIWPGGTVYLSPPERPGTITIPPAAVPRSGGRPGSPGGGEPAPGPPITPVPVNIEDMLKGEQRDAFVALKALFESYGLGTLAPKILEYVQQGYGADTIAILLQQTAEYKQRFAANEARRAAGMPVLSPQEYLATEEAYRQIMRQSGLPAGFYDQPNDFTNFLKADVSPTELKTRVDLATQAGALAPVEVKTALAQMGIGQEAVNAYFLDPQKTTALIQKQLATAQVGAGALAAGLEFNQGRAEQLALQGVSAEEARTGFGAISGFLSEAQKLGQIYGQQYDQATAEAEVFEDSGTAQGQRKRLASQERASFSGATGTARNALAVQRNR